MRDGEGQGQDEHGAPGAAFASSSDDLGRDETVNGLRSAVSGVPTRREIEGIAEAPLDDGSDPRKGIARIESGFDFAPPGRA